MRVKTWIGMALAASVLVLGVTGVAQAQAVPRPAPDQGAVAAYPAEEYFTGIFFGIGPVADRLPEMKQVHAAAVTADPAQAARIAAVAAGVVAEIKTSDPGFLDGFQAAVTSGDRVRVRAALGDGSEVLAKAFAAAYPDLVGDEEMIACNLAACAFAVAIVAVVWLWVAVAEAIFMGEQVQWVDDGGLLVDQLVDRIAVELALRR